MSNPNFALNKRVLEECNTPEAMLDGNLTDFTGTSGYCGVHVPSYLTIDLGQNYPIGYIRFLLMNRGKEDTNHGLAKREYFYRLLACEDTPHINNTTKWHVIYDSLSIGRTDWQCFTLSKPMQIRYLRIHAIENRKNNGFHIIQFEAYEHPEALPEGLPEQLRVVSVNETIDTSAIECEIGDGLPLYKRLNDITGIISSIMKDDTGKTYLEMSVSANDMPLVNKVVKEKISYEEEDNTYNINGDDIKKIISNFANDVKIIERNTDGIERAVISPVQAAMTESRRSNTKWTFWGLVSAVVSILLTVIQELIQH